MIVYLLRWIAVLAIAFVAGKLMAKIKMPAILGWLIAGMLLGPHAAGLMPQQVLDTEWYKTNYIRRSQSPCDLRSLSDAQGRTGGLLWQTKNCCITEVFR